MNFKLCELYCLITVSNILVQLKELKDIFTAGSLFSQLKEQADRARQRGKKQQEIKVDKN